MPALASASTDFEEKTAGRRSSPISVRESVGARGGLVGVGIRWCRKGGSQGQSLDSASARTSSVARALSAIIRVPAA